MLRGKVSKDGFNVESRLVAWQWRTLSEGRFDSLTNERMLPDRFPKTTTVKFRDRTLAIIYR